MFTEPPNKILSGRYAAITLSAPTIRGWEVALKPRDSATEHTTKGTEYRLCPPRVGQHQQYADQDRDYYDYSIQCSQLLLPLCCGFQQLYDIPGI